MGPKGPRNSSHQNCGRAQEWIFFLQDLLILFDNCDILVLWEKYFNKLRLLYATAHTIQVLSNLHYNIKSGRLKFIIESVKIM